MSRFQANNSLREIVKQFAIACFALCALAATSGSAKEPAPFHIQAHRGAGDAFPENTLESFEWSWNHGVTPESDLRTTKDGTIVCFHDPNFKRVPYKIDEALKESSVEKLPLAEVQKLDVGSFRAPQFAGQHIPTLASVFAEMQGHPERLLYIDIKAVKLDQLAALVREHKVEQQIIFTSEHPRLIRDWKKILPESHTLLWNRGTEEQLAKKMADLRKTKFAGITHLQIHVQVSDLNSDEPFMPSSAFLRKLGEELKSHGIVFQTFSAECKDQKVYERLLALGAQSFATDYPEVTLAAVKSFREKTPQ
jgi:glycerophosphoryl diester phosphodiesterase